MTTVGFITVAISAVLLLLIAYLIAILANEDRADQFRARLFRLVYRITGKRDHEKLYISNDIRSQLNDVRKRLHYGETLLPVAVSVDWIDGCSTDSYTINEGEYIVRLNSSNKQLENVLRLTEVVVSRTVLIGLRHVLPDAVQGAIDLTIIRKILEELPDKRMLDKYMIEIYQPKILIQPGIRDWIGIVDEIDDQGLFERFLLVEFDEVARNPSKGRSLHGSAQEFVDFVRFVHRIAMRKENEKIPLRFIQSHIRTFVLMVAKVDKLVEDGIGPYMYATNTHAQEYAITSLYVLLWEKPHLLHTRPADHARYTRAKQELAISLERRPFLNLTFQSEYAYMDPNGHPRIATLSRFRVVRSLVPNRVK